MTQKLNVMLTFIPLFSERTQDIRSVDFTAPPSEHVEDYSMYVPPSVKAANSKSRSKYSLRTDEST